MSLELPVTYLQTVPLPQLPLSTAGLPSQTTGVSQVPLTVMAVAHVFLIPEVDRNGNNNSVYSSSPRHPHNVTSSSITSDDPVTRRKRVTFVIDPIASYTKDLDVSVARCVAASSVTSLRFQNESALYGLRTSLHPLDIIVSHSTPADCIRVLPSLVSWYRATSNVVSTTDNQQGWKAVIPKTGQPPLPATFKLQHEMPQDHTWYVNPYFSLTPADDPEQGAQDWTQLANNTLSPNSRFIQNPNNSHGSIPRGGGLTPGAATEGSIPRNLNDISAISASRPPLSGTNNSSSVLTPMRGNTLMMNSSSPMPSSNNDATGDSIAWLLPHAKRDGGASERQAAALLTLERHKNEVALTQLEAVKTSLESEKTASRQQKMALESENKELKDKVKKLEHDLRTFRIERVAAADNVQQLTSALKDSANRVVTSEDKTKQYYGPDKLTPEPLLMSRPESMGPLPTSMQINASGPSDAEVLAALMLQKSLKPSENNNNNFQSASASPFVNQQQQHASASRGASNVGRRGPSPISRRSGGNNYSTSRKSVDPNATLDASEIRNSDESNINNKPPPSPLVIDTHVNLNPPPPKPAWNNVLGDTPEEKNLDPYGLTNSETAFTKKDRKEHATLVRSLLVKNSMPSQMEKMGASNTNTGNRPPSGLSSRSSTPDSRAYERPTASSAQKQQGSSYQYQGTYKQQANRNIRSGSPASASRTNRGSSPGGARTSMDESNVQATTASLYNLNNHLKAGRKLIQELRSS